MSAVDRWLGFWFGPLDLQRVALMRVGWGLLGLIIYGPLWHELGLLFTDAGLYPLAARSESWGPLQISLIDNPLWEIGSLGGIQALWGLWMLSFVCTALGVLPRLFQPLAWLILVSFINRNGLWNTGADTVMQVFGFYLLFMPLGAVWSARSWLRGADLRERAQWPLRLFQLNLCLLYVKTGVVKAANESWQKGEAVYHALMMENYTRVPTDAVLAWAPAQWVAEAANWGTLVIEIGFPMVWIRKLRGPWLLAAAGMHVGIWAFLHIGPFTMAMLWCYLAFLPLGEGARGWLDRRLGRQRG